MKGIKEKISRLNEREEKKFLTDAVNKYEKFWEEEDKQSLYRLIARLNNIHRGLSEEGVVIADLLIRKIEEGIKEL